MSSTWKLYQTSAAEFFHKRGFTAKLEHEVTGARGKHEIDVFVTGKIKGIAFRWVVECKAWNSNIPKEKVMALLSIVQDVGADRGFLLSETGFQSGAIRAVNNTNITLTSLADLEIETRKYIAGDEVSMLRGRRKVIHDRLWRLHKKTDNYFSEFMFPMGRIGFLDLALDDGLAGNFPVIYTVEGDDRPTASDWPDLVEKLTKLLDDAEQYAVEHEAKAKIGE